jgi:hypothetical protein
MCPKLFDVVPNTNPLRSNLNVWLKITPQIAVQCGCWGYHISNITADVDLNLNPWCQYRFKTCNATNIYSHNFPCCNFVMVRFVLLMIIKNIYTHIKIVYITWIVVFLLGDCIVVCIYCKRHMIANNSSCVYYIYTLNFIPDFTFSGLL